MRRYTFYSQNYKEPRVFLTNEDFETLWHRIDADECRLATGDMVKVESMWTGGEWWTFGCYVLSSEWLPIEEKDLDVMIGWDRLVLASLVRKIRIDGFVEGVEAEKRDSANKEDVHEAI